MRGEIEQDNEFGDLGRITEQNEGTLLESIGFKKTVCKDGIAYAFERKGMHNVYLYYDIGSSYLWYCNIWKLEADEGEVIFEKNNIFPFDAIKDILIAHSGVIGMKRKRIKKAFKNLPKIQNEPEDESGGKIKEGSVHLNMKTGIKKDFENALNGLVDGLGY